MLRQRGLGNGPMQLYKKLREQHSEAWLRQTALYLTDMEPFCTAAAQRLVTVVNPKEPPQPSTLPQLKWIQSVYIMDTLQRLPEVKATITSTFGAILKLDSTKKIVKKLTGRASGTAAWMTNLGNEHGQVLISVLTTHEGGGLEPMLRGIIERYSAAEVSPPSLLYVDRDCCSSRTKGFFTSSWPELEVRLDIWHFMRRIASGVTTDSHQLYRSFMGGLSQAIFEWEKVDLDCLKMAKEQAMKCEGIPNPSEADVMRRISRRELALHCRRSTRGVQETTRLIQALLLAYSGPHGNDTLGVPLLDSVRIWGIWQDQQRHLSCLQDPPGIQLYRQTGTLTKGGLQLPVYRCARGSTSLESFHLHLNRFIPGNSANDVHYQAYLLEGLVRWNQDRAAAALPSSQEPWCYSGQIRHGVNQLANKVLKHSINPSYTLPRKYTGELIGVEYLYQQTSAQLDVDTVIVDMETSSVETPPVCEDDEGFDEDQTGTDDWTVASVNNVLAELCDGNAELTAVRSPIMQSSVTGRSAPPALHDLSRLSAAGLASPRSHATRTPASRSSQPPSASASFTSVDASSETKSASSQSPCQPLVMQPPVEDPPSTHIPATRTGVSRKSRSKGPPALISALPVSVLPSRPVTVTASVSTVNQPAHSTSSSQPPFASLSMSSVHTASNDEDSVGPDNIPGYGRVQQLADFLVSHRDQQCLTTTAAASVVELYNRLSAYDKQQTVFPPRHKPTLDKGRFKRPKSRCAVVPGAESVQRCMLGSNEGPATRPGANRVMESLVWRLCELHPADVTVKGKRTSRWHLILSSYSHIRNLLANNAVVMRETQLQLGHINQKTLSEWVNKQATNKDRLMLEQGLRLSPPPMTSTTPLPSANPQPTTLDTGSEGERHHFDLPESTAGQAKVRHRRKQQKQLATSENPVQIACAPQHSGPVCLLVPQADPNAPPMVLALPPAFLPQYAPATSTPIPPALFTPPSGLQQTHSQPLSKTQEWRNKKRQGLDLHGQATKRKRKVFDCKRCGKERSSSNHKQFYGKWWCSEKSGMPYDAWLVEQKQSRTERKKDK